MFFYFYLETVSYAPDTPYVPRGSKRLLYFDSFLFCELTTFSLSRMHDLLYRKIAPPSVPFAGIVVSQFLESQLMPCCNFKET